MKRTIIPHLILLLVLLGACDSNDEQPNIFSPISSLSFSTDKRSGSLTLQNNGEAPGSWSISKLPTWLVATTTQGTIEPGDQVLIPLQAEFEQEAGTYSDALIIDTEGRQVSIQVELSIKGAVLGSDQTMLSFTNDIRQQSLVLRNNGDLAAEWHMKKSPDWLNPGEERGTILPDRSHELVLAADIDQAAGTYSDELIIEVGNQQVAIAVNLEVQRAFIEADEVMLSFSNDMEHQSILLKNSGDLAGQWTLKLLPSWLSADKTSGMLEPGDEASIALTADLNQPAGSYTGELLIDAEGRSLAIQLSLEVRSSNIVINQSELKFTNNESQISTHFEKQR